MCEFLVKADDNPGDHPDLWKRGMIASPIRPDGFEWGRLELLPRARGGKFIRIRIPGVTPEEFEAQCEADLGRKPLEPEDSSDSAITRRPAIRFDLDSFNALERQRMRSGGAHTISAVDLELKLSRNGKTKAQGRAERLAGGG